MKAADLVGDIEVEPITFDGNEIITDVFLIVRFVSPDRDAPGISYTASVGYTDDTIKLGTLDIVYDRILHHVTDSWED